MNACNATETIKLTPAIRRMVDEETAKLASMPAHSDPSRRPVVVLAREGRKRPMALARYHAKPVGASVRVDGFDAAVIVADA